MDTKVTSKDIAKMAGVSQATVSYILNDKSGKRISKKTRDKVMSIARELNYIPNSAAQRLKSKRTKCVVIRIATNLTMRRYHLMLQGIRAVMGQEGYSLLLSGLPQEGLSCPDYITACLSGQADGIIYISSDNNDIPDSELKTIRENGIPISVVDCMSSMDDISSISYDYFSSTFRRAEMMLDGGFRKFIYIRPEYDNLKEESREKGIRAALAGSGASLEIRKIFAVDANSSSFRIRNMTTVDKLNRETQRVVKEIAYNSPSGVAFICSSLEVADSLARYLYERWLTDPGSFPRPWYECVVSYHFDHYAIGCEAARILLDEFNGSGRHVKLTQQPILDLYTEDSF